MSSLSQSTKKRNITHNFQGQKPSVLSQKNNHLMQSTVLAIFNLITFIRLCPALGLLYTNNKRH